METIILQSWADFVVLIQEHYSAPCWIFRGQSDESWTLRSSFERAFSSIDRAHWNSIERYTVSAFRRRLHLFDADPPPAEDQLEWLALMQHHGAPTRLLDWTRSPYVAAFFALDGDFSKTPAVWLLDSLILQNDLYEIDSDLLENLTRGLNTGSPAIFGPHVMTRGNTAVYPATPFRQNARIAAQQGIFLVGGNLDVGFEGNLMHHFRKGSTWVPTLKRILLKFSTEKRLAAIAALRQSNVHASSLFPGVDGHARSVRVDALLFARQLDGNRFLQEGHWDDQF